jgi:hypothetical protein
VVFERKLDKLRKAPLVSWGQGEMLWGVGNWSVSRF